MMKVRDKHETTIRFKAEDGAYLDIGYDNRGEPYREGISVSFREADGDHSANVFLDRYEAGRMRDVVDRLFPRTKLWTATTDGDNCDLTTTLHPSETAAQNRVLNDLRKSKLVISIPESALNDTKQLRELWERVMDGACIIQEHEV